MIYLSSCVMMMQKRATILSVQKNNKISFHTNLTGRQYLLDGYCLPASYLVEDLSLFVILASLLVWDVPGVRLYDLELLSLTSTAMFLSILYVVFKFPLVLRSFSVEQAARIYPEVAIRPGPSQLGHIKPAEHITTQDFHEVKIFSME